MPNSAALLKIVIEASWQGSLVILLILLLRPVCGLRVPARWRSWLWALVLVRLLVPAFLLPPSPASLQNLPAIDRPLEEAGRVLDRRAAPEPAPPPLRGMGPEADEAAPPTSSGATPPVRARSWWQVASAVWAIGFAASAAFIALATLRLQRRVRRDATAAEEPIERIWSRCCARLAIAHPPRLLATDCVASPALLGVWRPALLIPRGASYSPEDWEHVFLHELAHFRRRDHWTQLLQLLALCAHWFNPLVWLGFRYLRVDRELAADEWALRHLEEGRAVPYGETLLKILTAQARPFLKPALVGIMEDGWQIKQRLRHIVSFTPRRWVGSLTGLSMAVGLVAVVLGRQPASLPDYEGLAPAEALVIAARHADKEAVAQLLANGADVNGLSGLRGERTALTAAVAAQAQDVIQLLLDKGADINLKPEKGDAPLVVALRKGWRDTALYLRSRGATCDEETLAAARGDLDAVEAYLAAGPAGYDKIKLLADVAAANGQRALFATLYDELKSLPEQRDYFPFSRGAFVTAIANGHRGIVEEMLARDPNLKRNDGTGDGVNRLAASAARTPGMREWLQGQGIHVPEYTDGERLITAAEGEDLPEIRRLLAAGVDIHYRGESDWTPLTKAATWGCPRAVKLLLERGADPNALRYKHYTTLELAKTPEVADLLLAGGAKLRQEDIRYAVTFGSRKLVQWFLDHGVDPVKAKGDERTLLFSAGSPEIVELLVSRGVDVNAKDDEGRTALIFAEQVRPQSPKLIAALLKAGADPNVRMKGGVTPLMAAQDGATVDALVAAGADLQAKDDHGNDVLYTGWGSGIPSRLEALLRHGLKLDPERAGDLLVNAIVLQRDLAAVKRLLALGASPHASSHWEGRRGGTALAAAISNGEFAIADVLRAAGAKDVGALSEAAAKGETDRMKSLLDAGANVDESSDSMRTPLHFATQQGQSAAVALLLERGANVNRFDASGLTALSLAKILLGQVEYQNYSSIHRLEPNAAKKALNEIVAAIQARNPDPNYRNADGETALMCGAGIGNVLGDFQPGDINAQRPDGMTALMLAIVSQPKNAPREGPGCVGITEKDSKVTQWMSARAHVVKTLLEKGADLSLRNKAGQTALDLARLNGNEEILALLEPAARK